MRNVFLLPLKTAIDFQNAYLIKLVKSLRIYFILRRKKREKMKKFALILITIVSLCSCQEIFENANAFMNSSSFERLVDRFESEERTKMQQPEKVMQYIGNVHGQKIMDLGAGTGYFTFRLAKAGAQVIAADVDDRFLDYMQSKDDTLTHLPKIDYRKVPYDSPNLKPNEVDKFLTVNTYHHIEDRVAYFKKVKQGIKPNGEVIIIDFFKKKLKFGPPKRHKVSAEEVVEELKKAGFTKFEKELDLLEYQYIIKAKRK